MGAITLSADEKYLYAVNLYKNTLVKIPTDSNDFDNIEEISIPNPGCTGGKMHPFALKTHNGKLYVGVSCSAEYSKKEADNTIYIYEYNFKNKRIFRNIFSSDYPKGYFHNEPSYDVHTQHWLTDLDFTDEGNIVIVLNDRDRHRYCKGTM
ncbi:MAG: hypothetical protein R2771_07320 [Saprospiraceae bacterium]